MGSGRYLTYDMLREGLHEALRRPPHARWLATSEAYMLHSGRESWLLRLDPCLDVTTEVLLSTVSLVACGMAVSAHGEGLFAMPCVEAL